MLERSVKLCIAFLPLWLAAGCATMSPEECRNANWRDVGLRDGQQGAALSHLDGRIKDCAESGVSVNTHAYLDGRAYGLRNYCRIENAMVMGLNGGYYQGVCPPDVDFVFRQRFQIGRAVYDLRAEVRGLDQRIESLERQLRATNQDEEKRLREASSDDERKRVRKAADDQRRDIRNDLGEADRRLHRKRDELRAAEFTANAVH